MVSSKECSLRNCARSISSGVGKPATSKAWEGERPREPKYSGSALESGLAGTLAPPADVCDVWPSIFTIVGRNACYSACPAAAPAIGSAGAVMAGLAAGAPGAGL
jgi:hypothetical protein